MNAAQAAMMSRIRTPLKDELMLGEITEAFADESNAGRKQFVVAIAPVEDGVAQRDLALRLYVPQRQDGDDNSALGKARTKGYSLLRAIDPSGFPAYPKKQGKNVYLTSTGEVVDYAGSAKASAGIDTLIFERMDELEPRLKGLKGTRVFFKPGKAKLDDQKRVSQFIDRVFGELRDGETYLTEGLVDEALQQEFIAALTAEVE